MEWKRRLQKSEDGNKMAGVWTESRKGLSFGSNIQHLTLNALRSSSSHGLVLEKAS